MLRIARQRQDECRTFFKNDPKSLISIGNYRFKQGLRNRPIDYWPSVHSECKDFITFINSILQTVFRFKTVAVNFSPTFCIKTDSDQTLQFLYSSYHNFQCLPTAHTIHSDDTKNTFMNRLKNFNLREYIEQSLRVISDKYDCTLVIIYSMTVYFTEIRNLLYGYGHKKSVYTNKSNMCLFLCLSCIYTFESGRLKLKDCKKEKKQNKRSALRIKKLFNLYLKGKNEKVIEKNQAFPERLFSLLENFLQANVFVYEDTASESLLLNGQPSYNKNSVSIISYPTAGNYKNNIHLLQKKRQSEIQHLSIIKNITMFGNKFICMNCNQNFRSAKRLSKHHKIGSSKTSKNMCISKKKCLQNKKLITVYNLQESLSYFFKLKDFIIEDNDFFFLTLNETKNGFYEVKVVLHSSSSTTVCYNGSCNDLQDLFKKTDECLISYAATVSDERKKKYNRYLVWLEAELLQNQQILDSNILQLTNYSITENNLLVQTVKSLRTYIESNNVYILCATEEMTKLFFGVILQSSKQNSSLAIGTESKNNI